MYNFAESQQNEKKEKLNKCLDKAHSIKDGKDVITKFFDCYEDVIKEYSTMENSIRLEFSNII